MTRHRIIIEGTGFVNEEIEERLLSFPAINRNLVNVVISTVRFANEIALNLPVYAPSETPKDKQNVIALALLIRLIDIVESIMILSAYGVRQEMKTLFRVFLDAYFLIANVCSDPEFVGVYFRADMPERLKMLKAGTKNDHPLFDELKHYATDEFCATLDQKIKEEKIQAFNSYTYADKVGCVHIYDSYFRLMSPSVHTGPRCLVDYVEADKERNITKIMHMGNMEVSHNMLYNTVSFLLKALNGICELFEQSDTGKIAKLEAELETAMKACEDPYDKE